MENYQKYYIKTKLNILMDLTICNTSLLSELSSRDVITSEEEGTIKSTVGQRGQARQLYEILLTRSKSFEILKQCLCNTKQTGALDVLNKLSTPQQRPHDVSASYKKPAKTEYIRSRCISEAEGHIQQVCQTAFSQSCPDLQLTQEENHHQISYNTEQFLGIGRSNSKVYKGKMSEYDVAVKVYESIKFDTAPSFRDINLLRDLEHKNILRFYNYEIMNGIVLFAYDFCFTSLNKCVEENTFPMSIYDIMIQTTKGIKYLHSNNIVHGRLIPENVLIKKAKNGSCVVKVSGVGCIVDTPKEEMVFTNDVCCLGNVFRYTTHNKISKLETSYPKKTGIPDMHDRLPNHLFPEIKSLINNMTQENPSLRPTCSKVLQTLKTCYLNPAECTSPISCTANIKPDQNVEQLDATGGPDVKEDVTRTFPYDITFSSSQNVSLDTIFFPNINSLTNFSAYSKDGFILGLDLGTEKCCTAFAHENDVHIIRNDLGKSTTASYVALQDADTAVIGEDAKKLAFLNPKHTFYETKCMIGQTLEDTESIRSANLYEFDISTENNILSCRSKQVSFSVEQIYALLIKFCIQTAQNVLRPTEIKHAVITIPVTFSEAQKAATKTAGLLAGLDKIFLLYEPTAAAITYAHAQPIKERKRVLIFDLGGATLNLSIVDLEVNDMRIVGHGGETDIGGNSFHLTLMRYCIKTFKSCHVIQTRDKNFEMDPRNMSLIRRECETQKIRLDNSEVVKVFVPCVFGNVDMDITITREQYHELTRDLVERLINTVLVTLEKYNVTKQSLDDVVLVGASTRAPMIQKQIEKIFPDKQITQDFSSDHTVAYGAALYAAYICQ